MYFHNQKFLLKISADPSTWEPKKSVRYKYLTPCFRFFCSSDIGFQLILDEGKRTITLKIGDIGLKGFQLTWNSTNKSVEVLTDKFSLYPLLVMPGSDSSPSLWFSNTSEYFASIEPNFKLSSLAVNQFFTQGYLMPDLFFIEGVRRISGRWFHFLGKPLNVPSCRWTEDLVPKVDDSLGLMRVEQMRESFLETVKNILTKCHCDEFLMSGGLDSRSIAIAAKHLGLSLPRVRIFFSSQSSSQEDLDFEVARRFCERERIDYSAIQQLDQRSLYFRSSEGLTNLSGLYGGDLLGGAWKNCLPISVETNFANFALCLRGQEEVFEYLNPLKTLSSESRELLGQQIFTHSDRSIFFFNVNHGWASPLANMRVSISPFAVEPLIEQILLIPQSLRERYQLYYQFYQLLSAGDNFPICSYFTHFFPEYSPPKQWGSEAKGVKSTQEYHQERSMDMVTETYQLMIERGLLVSRDHFFTTALRPDFRFLCASFHSVFQSSIARP